MKCGKIHALEIFKTLQIRPKASIFTSSSKGGHAPRPLHHAFDLAGRRGSHHYQYFTIFGLLFQQALASRINTFLPRPSAKTDGFFCFTFDASQ